MQRMFNVAKWTRLDEGRSLVFGSNRPRVVRLEVNSREPVGLYLLDVPSGTTLFLAASCGRDTIEFHCGGNFSIVSDGEVFIYTADGETIHAEIPDPVIFTRIAERRQVPPEIKAITDVMNRNIERRLAQQASEFNAILRRVVHNPPRAALQPQSAVAPLGSVSSEKQSGSTADPKPAEDPPASGSGLGKAAG